MDEEIRAMLTRQAEWQRNRSDLPWAEKLRQSVIMRKSLSCFQSRGRRSGRRRPESFHRGKNGQIG